MLDTLGDIDSVIARGESQKEDRDAQNATRTSRTS